jgi:hypothetical protein
MQLIKKFIQLFLTFPCITIHCVQCLGLIGGGSSQNLFENVAAEESASRILKDSSLFSSDCTCGIKIGVIAMSPLADGYNRTKNAIELWQEENKETLTINDTVCDLEIIIKNSYGDASVAPVLAKELIEENVVAVVGLEYSSLAFPAGEVLNSGKTPMVATTATNPAVTLNRPYAFIMGAELVALADLLIEGEMVEDFIMELGHMMDTDFVTDVHLIYQDNKSTLTMVTTGGGKPRTKYMKVREEFVKEHLKTWEVELEYISTKQMLVDLMTKPLGGELYHALTHRLLGGHRYACLNNRGVKGKRVSCVSESASVVSVVPILADLTCSNHAPAWSSKKHSNRYVPDQGAKIKQHKGEAKI